MDASAGRSAAAPDHNRFGRIRQAIANISLQGKVLGVVGAVYLLLTALSALVHHLYLQPSFDRLELDAAEQDLARVQQALQREVDFLSTTASDWGVWSDTWLFMQGKNPDYETNNLTGDAIKALHLDLLYLYDTQGFVRWGAQVDSAGRLNPPPALASEPLVPGHPLRSTDDPDRFAGGLLQTPAGPLLVGAHTITTSDGTGAPQGMVVFGRFLNETAVLALAIQAGVNIKALPLSTPELPPGQSMERRLRSLKDVNQLYHMMNDMDGRPVEWLRLDLPRKISAQGRSAILAARGLLALSGLATVLVLMFMLRQIVLKPVRQLTLHAVRLGSSGNPAPLFGGERRDEVGILARELNQMMTQLADTRRRLAEQSYDSGKAAMAGGILHNIGNSVTPLAVQAQHVQRELQDAPLQDLDVALAELEQSDGDPGRRRNMQTYARLALAELQQGLGRALESTRQMDTQIAHINRILADQERHSHAAQALETTRLESLLRESFDLLSPEHRRSLELLPDASISEVPEAQVPRVTLKQVFVNLLINAAEAQGSTDRSRGRLWLRVEREDALLHIHLRDEGCGFDAQVAERLFERGFSTKHKERSSGLGLHWCSNTLQALGGSLQATSPGAGQGASFHIRLPWPERPAAQVVAETRGDRP